MASWWINALISSGIFAGGLWISKRWVSNFIESKFKKATAEHQAKLNKEHSEFKSSLDRDIQFFKFQIDSKFNRISKIHDKELEVLPEAWNLMLHAVTHVSRHVGLTLVSHAEISRMSSGPMEEFLKSQSWLRPSDVQEILNARDAQSTFTQKFKTYNKWKAETAFDEFRNFILKNKIFIRNDIFVLLDAMSQKIHTAKVNFDIGSEVRDSTLLMQAYTTTFQKEIDEMSEKIRARLAIEEA